MLRRRHYFSEWNPGDVEISFYPPRIARRLPPWTGELSEDIKKLLEEVYAALQANSRRLAMMGARALIDMIAVAKVGDVGGFSQKIVGLQKAGFISEKARVVLEAALDVGNAASHRGHRPEQKQVLQVMDVVENLLHATVLQKVSRSLRNGTPKRKRKKQVV